MSNELPIRTVKIVVFLSVALHVPANHRTPMLTVWRKLFVERDHMDTTDLHPQGQPEVTWSHRSGNITAGGGTNMVTTDISIYQQDQFQNGLITIVDSSGGEHPNTVTANTPFGSSVLTLGSNAPSTK